MLRKSSSLTASEIQIKIDKRCYNEIIFTPDFVPSRFDKLKKDDRKLYPVSKQKNIIPWKHESGMLGAPELISKKQKFPPKPIDHDIT